MPTYRQLLAQACSSPGGLSSLAKALGVKPPTVHQWITGKRPVPIEHCTAIERATEGVVTRQDLRPDDWKDIWPELAQEAADLIRRMPVSRGGTLNG